MRNSKNWFVTAAGLVALASAILFAGCGDEANNPVAPGGTGNEPGALKYVLDNYGDPFGALHDSNAVVEDAQLGAGNWSLSAASDTAVVGKAGGTITLNFGALASTLKIPSDAVCSSGGTCAVRITASALDFQTPLGPVLLYEFGPDGLKFNKPCELKVSTGFVPGQLVSLVWFNPSTGVWERQQQCQVLAHGEVKFTVNHFSKYGIS